MTEDGSNGYEGIADIYVAGRGTRPLVGDAIGADIVRAWARAFPPGATVLDLGSGPGEPSTRILQEAGLATFAVEASSAMVAAFRERFPGVPIEQNTVEASELFNRTFDGVLAWGLLFLLKPVAQALVIEKVACAPSDWDRRPVMASSHSCASRGAVKRKRPPGLSAPATFSMTSA